MYRPLERPENANGEKVFGKFRSGDRRFDLIARKVKKVFLYRNNWRYLLESFPDVSYAENELLEAKESEEKYEVRKIIGKKTVNKKILYLVWWKRYLKKDATFVPKETLLEDGLNEYIKEYEDSLKADKKKK